MKSTVALFSYDKFNISWVNAISKIGYILISENRDDSRFVTLWQLGMRIADYLNEQPAMEGGAIGFHYVDHPNHLLRLFVIPRFSGDYPDNNLPYGIAESETQPETSTVDNIMPLVSSLESYLDQLKTTVVYSLCFFGLETFCMVPNHPTGNTTSDPSVKSEIPTITCVGVGASKYPSLNCSMRNDSDNINMISILVETPMESDLPHA
jgi:hypothetical protein